MHAIAGVEGEGQQVLVINLYDDLIPLATLVPCIPAQAVISFACPSVAEDRTCRID
jgi:hypothetical protein